MAIAILIILAVFCLVFEGFRNFCILLFGAALIMLVIAIIYIAASGV